MVLGIKPDVVVYKDSNVCILAQFLGVNKEFYSEFSKITSEGYELKAIFTSVSGAFGFVSGGQALHYFQKLSKSAESSVKSEEVSNSKESGKDYTPIIVEMRECPKCKTVGHKKWCSECGTLTMFE